MKIVPAIEEKLMEAVRIGMAKNPLITVSDMQDELERKFERLFTRPYVGRLMHKVSGRELEKISHAKIAKRIAQLRATHEVARTALMNILTWQSDSGTPRPMARDYVEAAKNLVMLDIAVMNAEVANGVYKDLEEASKQRDYSALPPEQRQSIVSAFSKWGLLPPGVTAQITERQITLHAPGTTPATNT